MIVRPPENWFRTLLVWRGSVLPAILPQLLLMLLVSLLAVLTDGHVFKLHIPLDTAPFPLVGVSLAIFLAFRNNASYARYVEARLLWGHLLIAARTLTSQVINYLPARSTGFDQDLCVRRLIAFTYALKHELRGTDASADLARYVAQDELERLRHKRFQPVALLDAMRAQLAGAAEHNRLPASVLWLIDNQLAELSSVVAGCERISNTPIPYPYGVLLHRTVYVYCFLLPFGLVRTLGAATPLISVFVAYTLFALEAIAAQVADPFGLAPNSLALDGMTRDIERSLDELRDQPLPPKIGADRRYQIT